MCDAELALIDKVELRLTLANTPNKLAELLKVYLCPLLTKYSSPHEAVRAKIQDVLTHLNVRINASKIPLPIAKLTEQLFQVDDYEIKSQDLLYLNQAVSNNSGGVAEGENAIELMVPRISQLKSLKDIGFDIILRFTEVFPVPVDLKVENDADALCLSGLLVNLYSGTATVAHSPLSRIERHKLKPSGLKLVTALPYEHQLAPLIVASCVANLRDAEELLRQALRNVDLNSPDIVLHLFDLFIKLTNYTDDEAMSDGPDIDRQLDFQSDNGVDLVQWLQELYTPKESMQVEDEHMRAIYPALIKLVQLLSRTSAGLLHNPKVIIGAVFHLPSEGAHKVYSAGLGFVNALARQASTENIPSNVCDTIITQVIFGEEANWPSQQHQVFQSSKSAALRRDAYSCLGQVLQKAPQILPLVFLFVSLRSESADFLTGIQHSLRECKQAVVAGLKDDARLYDVLDDALKSNSSIAAKTMAVAYAREFPFSDVRARYFCMLALKDSNIGATGLVEDARKGLDRETYSPNESYPDFTALCDLCFDVSSNKLDFYECSIKLLQGARNDSPSSDLKRYYDFVLRGVHCKSPSALDVWRDLAMTSPELIHGSSVDSLLETVGSPDAHTARTAASVLAVYIVQSGNESLIESLTSKLDNPKYLLALCYTISHSSLTERHQFSQAYSDIALTAIAQHIGHSELAVDSVAELCLSLDLTIDKSIKDKVTVLAKKEDERAIFALGCIARAEQFDQAIVETIKSIHTSKNIGHMLASGEALCAAAGAYNSDAQSLYLDRAFDIVMDALESDKPALKKYTGAWLLSIIRLFSGEDLNRYMHSIHTNLVRLLSDKEEAVQELAGQALALCYYKDKGRHDLIRDWGSWARGDLKIAGGGTSGVKYREMFNAAVELNSPELVYLFILADTTTGAITKNETAYRGMRKTRGENLNLDNLKKSFTFSQLQGSRFFRFRFDPSPAVRTSMNNIWAKLGGHDITIPFLSTLRYLLDQLNSRDWRVRESAVLAVADLMSGKELANYKDELELLWKCAFRAIDDVKESVRNAGNALGRALIVNLPGLNKCPGKIPSLLDLLCNAEGVQSQSKDVQEFALRGLLKLTDLKNHDTILSYIPGLVSILLELVSTLEPEAMNYVQLNADKYGVTSQLVDTSRMTQLRHSPIMEAIERLLAIKPFDASQNVKSLLANINSVGTPTRLAVSRIIVLRASDFKNQANELLEACVKRVRSDRNEVVVQSYCVASAYLCSYASEKAINRYIQTLYDWYASTELDQEKRCIAKAVFAIAVHSPTTSLDHRLVALEFVGKSDTDDDTKAEFLKAWQEIGSNSSAQSSASEIVTLLQKRLGSAHHEVRQSAALACAEFASHSSKEGTSWKSILMTLMDACEGRSWAGKETIFDALVTLACAHEVQVCDDGDGLLGTLNSIALREARRGKNKDYQKHSLVSFARYVAVFADQELCDALCKLCAENTAEEEMTSSVAQAIVTYIKDGPLSPTEVCTKLLEIFSTAIEELSLEVSPSIVSDCCHLVQSKPTLDYDDIWTKVYTKCGPSNRREDIRKEAARLGRLLKKDFGQWISSEPSDIVRNEMNR